MRESEILFERGPYWIKAATFGTGRFKPKSKGFEVYKTGMTHSVRVASIGYDGAEGMRRAKAEIEKRIAAEK